MRLFNGELIVDEDEEAAIDDEDMAQMYDPDDQDVRAYGYDGDCD